MAVKTKLSAVVMVLQVHVLNPLCLRKMDLLAYLYSKEEQAPNPELEKFVLCSYSLKNKLCCCQFHELYLLH